LDDTIFEAYFELGRLYYLTDRCDQADETLSYFISRTADEVLKEHAEEILEICEGKTVKKPYRVDLILGSQYDSNVIVEPENPPVSADEKSDYRALVYIKASGAPVRRRTIDLNIDYSFYQSLHGELDDYNVHHHKLNPQLDLKVSNLIKPSAGYNLAYSSLGGDSYSFINSGYAKVLIKESQMLSTDVIYEYSDNEYWNTEVCFTNSLRTGHKNSIGITQNFSFQRVTAKIYYFADYTRAEAPYWAYDGDRGGTALGTNIIPFINIHLSGEYNERRYLEDYPGFGKKRVDKMQQYSFGINYRISKRIAVILNYLYTRNKSNLDIFDYKRHITSIFFRIGLL
jgi:hypothetical protein